MPFPGGNAAVEHGQFHVLLGRGPGQKIETLKDKAHFPIPDLRQFILGKTADIDAVQQITARSELIEAAQDIHEGRFARSGRSHDGHKLPPVNGKGDAGEGRHG